MAGDFLSYTWVLIFFIIGLLELFFFQYFTQYRFSSLRYFKKNTTKVIELLGSNIQVTFISFWHIVGYWTLKIDYKLYSEIYNFYNIYFLFFILLQLTNYIVFKNFFLKKNSLYQPINILLFILIYIYTLCADFICLLLVIEIVTTVYFFFFLKNFMNDSTTIIKYKNLISYYLWLSFFTLLIFVLTLMYWVYLYGTLSFNELQNFNINNLTINIILMAFFWKLGVPAFHFFKLELYRYLDFIPLILFSTLSLIINTLMIIYFLWVVNSIVTYNFFIVFIAILFNIFLLVQSLDKIFLFYFFAISSINTWAFFLIIGLS